MLQTPGDAWGFFMVDEIGVGFRRANWRPIMGFIGALVRGLFRTIVHIR